MTDFTAKIVRIIRQAGDDAEFAAELIAGLYKLDLQEREEAERKASRDRKRTQRERSRECPTNVPGTNEGQREDKAVTVTVTPSPFDPPPDLIRSESSPDLLSPPEQTRVGGTTPKKPVRWRPLDYTAPFERLWSAIGNGGKGKAFKAYQQVGEPDPGPLIAAWERWCRVVWIGGIGMPYLATWLNSGDWQVEPKPKTAATGPPPLPYHRPARVEEPNRAAIAASWGTKP